MMVRGRFYTGWACPRCRTPKRECRCLQADRLTWAVAAVGLLFYAALGTVLVVFAMGGGK